MVKKESKKVHHHTESSGHLHHEHRPHHTHHERHQIHSQGSPIENELLRNFVNIQKVHVDLAEKFDALAKQISSLLALFEVTAKRFATQAPLGEYEKDKEFLDKIDKLLDQNKTLAKGLTLMEERLRERVYGSAPVNQQQQQFSQPTQFSTFRQIPSQVQTQTSPQVQTTSEELFQPSISSEEETSFPPSSNQKRPLPHF